MLHSKHLKMNFLIFTAMVAYFSIFQINCRSVQIDALSGSEVREDKDLIHDSEISGRYSWKRLKPILRREIQRIKNIKGTDANKFHNEKTMDESDVKKEFASNKTHNEIPQMDYPLTTSNFSDSVISNNLNQTGMANMSFVKSELTNSSQIEETVDESDVEEVTSNIIFDKMPHLDLSLTTSNFSDSVISDNLIQTGMANLSFVKSELTNSSQIEETVDESDVEELTSNIIYDEMPHLDLSLTKNNFSGSVISVNLNQTGMANMSFVKSELTNSSQIEETVDESDVEELTSDKIYDEMPHLDLFLTTNNFPDSVISDILNQTADSILFQALNDNGSTIDSFEFDETSVLSQGGHIATLQEVSTMGFELLIDSETKQNLLLTELLSSQSNIIDDFTDNSYFTTLEFSHINQSEEDEVTTYEEVSFPGDTDLNADEDDSDFTTLEEFNHNNEIEEEEIPSNEEATDEIEINENELELLDPIQNENGTEQISTEVEDPMCPDPGWCVFWFFALDTCAKDSHCHGSRICCTIGCSKTCIDVDEPV